MISLHIVTDFCPPEKLDRALLYLQRVKPPTVNVAMGAQVDIGMQFCERIHQALPNMVIQMRLLEDTGYVMSHSPQEWYTRYVTPRLSWLKANRIVPVVDNETSGSDEVIKIYVERESSIADMLHKEGLSGVFCRFATGNIVESQYVLLKPLLDKLNSWDWIGPNEYSNVPSKSSSGHLERYKRIETVAGRSLNMSIGECGILNDYQARAGYRSVGMSDRDMAAQLLADEIWYKGGTIPRHVFCIGGGQEWASLQVGDGALEFWEDYYSKIQLPSPTPAPLPPAPLPPFTMGMRYVINTPQEFVNLRQEADVAAKKLGEVPNKAIITALEEKLVGGEFFRRIQFGTLAGWVSMQGGAVTFAPYLGDASTVQIPIDLLNHIATSLQQQASALKTLAAEIATASENMQRDYTVIKTILDQINAVQSI